MIEHFRNMDLWRYLRKNYWSQQGFNLEKAYVCAAFAELAYYRVPDFELGKKHRIKLVPCEAYQQILLGVREEGFADAMRSIDVGDFFEVSSRYAIIVGVRTPNVVIIAIRGTKYLYDWLINLRAYQMRYEGAGGAALFHSGFFRAIYSCFEPIRVQVRKWVRSGYGDVPIYVTGHSLGGAMAAIFHAVWDVLVTDDFVPNSIARNHRASHSGYTFGMPRYGDSRALLSYRQPYHLCNDGDIVPTVPPSWAGFVDCSQEYKLDGLSTVSLKNRQTQNFASWIYSLASGNGIKHHMIELYRDRIATELTAKHTVV